ncbi:apolipoprotein N-acyltransferase [Nitratifractor salsuginis]|uniref:Apolipoprotein N-acyltransferase n=1 Tax=Nitratifractor salsuginis (strain DSM 16511 / JCM 12458 / E9I37-1) TaxID=749222 RepID=E6X2X4_NITSE|nr:apolipoprotein N-acyltransferase [Nitratifractor salsuginis]ADV47257.1 apolipoprotein N-acyltransferase [Nitratifractor salsuginis DSM 16511]
MGALLTALSGSAFLYLAWLGWEPRWLDTLLALIFYWRLLGSDRRHWFWTGFFLGLLWFWWLGVSFIHYGHPGALPFVDLTVALIYALIFWIFAFTAETMTTWAKYFLKKFSILNSQFSIRSSWLKAAALLTMSYAHPFGFDWFKAELPLVPGYFGVDKISFASLLFGLCLAREAWEAYHQKRHRYAVVLGLLGTLFLLSALNPSRVEVRPQDPEGRILLAPTHIPIEAKWRPETLSSQIGDVFQAIDRAIDAHASLVVLPESVLPLFLNREPQLLRALEDRSKKIDILLGALYRGADGQNRNSAYLFHQGSYRVANKVVLVPFGEANPLPDWASRWVNRLFFDGAPDYRPASHSTDFLIGGVRYRIGVCYEGSSEILYKDRPSHLLLLSNNGWFHPSIEPTLQRLLLEYYVRKYGTAIYNSVNMGPSYLLRLRNRGETD